MGERPVEFPGLGVERAKLQSTVADASDGDYFGVVSSRENLVGLLEVLISESLLNQLNAGCTQESHYPLARDAGEKCSVRDGGKHDAVFCQEDIGGGEFGDVAQHVADDGVVEASSLGFEQGARIVGIKTSGLGIDRHVFKGWPAIGG